MVEYRYMRFLRILHHWFVPHEGNNHRAKALHHDALFAYVLLLMVFNLGIRVLHTAAPDILGYATDIRVDQLLQDTNAKRAEAGLSALSLNETLSQAAAGKAADMFANNYWAHTSPQGKTPWDFIIASGYKYTLAGENLAKNFQTSSGVVNAWMESPTHKANIVKSGYKDVGFAVVNGVLNGEETTLVVQMFGTSNAPAIAQVPKVEAAAPVTAPQTEPVIQNEPETVVPTKPAEVAETAIPAPSVAETPVLTSGYSFQKFIESPHLDIPSLTRNIVYVVVGILIGILAVDGMVANRKRIVRLVGHNFSHILFFTALMIGALAIGRGSLL